MAKDEQIRIDITARDDASRTVDKVADKVDDLEKADPEVHLTADDDASRTIAQVDDDARALAQRDVELVLKAKADAAKADLAAYRDELKRVEDQAGDTARRLDDVTEPRASGGALRGNAIADLTGPLGDASSAASDFAGVFDGLGDAAEAAAGKLGLSASQAGMLSSAVGGLGVAVAAGAAVWTMWKQSQEKARQKAEETRKSIVGINDALEAGDYRKAAEGIQSTFGAAAEAARKAGVNVDQFTGFLMGTQAAIPGVTDKINAARAALEAVPDDIPRALRVSALTESQRGWLDLGAALDDARIKYGETTRAAEYTEGVTDDLAGALDRATRETQDQTTANDRLTTSADRVAEAFDRIRGKLDMRRAAEDFSAAIQAAMDAASDDAKDTVPDIRAVEDAILRAGETGRLNPIQVESMIEALKTSDLRDVKALAEAWFAANPVGIVSRVQRPRNFTEANNWGFSNGGGGMPIGLAAPVVNVTQSFPRGIRIDASREAHRAAMRNGRLYQRLGQ